MKVIKIEVGELKTNCYIVYKEESNKAIVIDPGDEYSKIESVLIKNNLYVGAILLTHGHFDHIGAVWDFSSQKLPIYIHFEDANKLTTHNNLGYMYGKNVHSVSANMIYSGEECNFGLCGLEVKAIHTPGHTRGSVVYIIGDYLFSGDTLFAHGYGRTDIGDGNFEDLKKSLRLLKNYINQNTKLMPGHNDY